MAQIQRIEHALARHHLTRLRDRDTDLQDWRHSLNVISELVALAITKNLPVSEHTVQTRLAEAKGHTLTTETLLVPILRAGIAMLPAFMRYLPQAKVGFVGQERDDETAIPSSYYAKFPSVHGKDLFVLEPMLATGGSAASTLETLLAEDAQPNSINLVSIIAAPQAIHRLHGFGQRLKISLLSVDQGLNEDNYIVPGLGDMGDLWVG